jgi:PKD repeat protein
MKNLALLLSLLSVGLSSATAQSITIGTVPGNAFCAGDTVSIPYTATGNFTNRNSFVVQISHIDGTFDKMFINAGSLRTPATSGLIPMVVPTDIALGMKYRLRIISSEPYAVSSNVSANDIALGPPPNPSFGYEEFEHELLFGVSGTPIQFSSSQNNSSVLWEFGPDATPATSTEKNPKITFASEGYKTVRLTAFSVGGCSRVASNQNQKTIYMSSCFPQIPKDARVDSVDFTTYDDYGTIWVVPGGRLRRFRGEKVFAEAGATVDESEITTIYYMKAGSVLKDLWTGYVVYEPGASIPPNDINSPRLFKCDNLEFDYSDAPPYKINQSSVSRVRGSAVRVYPNPTTDRLTIEHDDNHIREISIRNTLGAEQFFVKPEGLGKTTVDVSRLAAGLYFLDLITDQGIETHKIVVQ